MTDTFHPRCEAGRDNHASIQDAIDRVNGNGGGVVSIPPGVWPIGRSLNIKDHVTLRGAGLTASTIALMGDANVPLIVARGDLETNSATEGWAVEALGLDGAADDAGAGASEAIVALGGASYVILRRLRIRNVLGDAILFRDGALNYMFLEEIFVESCGASGITMAPSAPSAGIFLTDVVVRNFARRSTGSHAAVRLYTRCHISQLHIEPVREGHTGIYFGDGSDQTVVSGVYVGLAGGTARDAEPSVRGICISTEAVRHLAAA
jgi:hypothetical protein